MNIRQQLEERISHALAAAGAPGPALIHHAARPEFGDYQANGVMAAAKAARTNPRQLAQTVLEHLDLSDLAESVEIAGPGFINIRLRSDWLAQQLATALDDAQLGIAQAARPQTVVVDYSGPNLAIFIMIHPDTSRNGTELPSTGNRKSQALSIRGFAHPGSFSQRRHSEICRGRVCGRYQPR